ncbi:MAG: putative polymerase sigma-E factor [Chloroflexi bacterium]|nr:putative polymerase sigma-E factor [Chloroflexota bacterium]
MIREPSDDQDLELAHRARRDPQAFAELYRRHVQPVYRYHLARTGLPAEAEDLTADTLFAALQGIEGFQARGSFAAWLFGIAQRKLAQHYRSGMHWDPLEGAEAQHDPSPSPEISAALQLELDQVIRALQVIAPERAEAVSLCYFGGLSAGEAGLVMEKSTAAVKMLISGGLGDLRQRLAFPALEEA